MKKIGVLASGRGTNLQAIFRSIAAGDINGQIVIVVSDNPDAYALQRARKQGVKEIFLNPSLHTDRQNYDQALKDILQGEGVDLVLLAGFMRLLSPNMVAAFPNRIMNIHPSLLPAFPGNNSVKQALEHGVKVTGCTVHFVDEGLDSGPIILQEAVPVLKQDTVETLQERVQAAEYRNYSRAVSLFCRDLLKIEGRRCFIDEHT